MANKYRTCGSMLKHNEVVNYIKQYPQKKDVLNYLKDFDIGIDNRVELIAELEAYFEIIEAAITIVPSEFREGVLMHIIYSVPYDDVIFKYASRSTWDKWRKRFLDEVIRLKGEEGYCDLLFEVINKKCE
ncbi:MAG TPA: hypothetical protein VJ916_00055 [Anaerovoracaceae bacterium]|nr:hypothetical protein [Anaerovoracaceae bacterium]